MLFRTAAAALLAFGITAAHAAEFSDVSTYVAFGDLNLSQPTDAKVLAARLQAAAMDVCLKANPDLAGRTQMRGCVDLAVATAMGKIEAKLDGAVHAKLINLRTAMATP